MPPHIPKYDAIGKTLRERILAGHYAHGMQLPSESALQSEFAVSRVTIRLALDILRRAGLVESRQGKGYFVRPVRALHDLGRLQGFGEMMASVGVGAHSVVLEVTEGPAAPEVQRALQLGRNDLALMIRRVRVGGGNALSYDVSHFPLDIGHRLIELDLAHADIFVLIEQTLGVDLGFADLTLDVTGADSEAARHLGVGEGDPLLRINRLTYDTKRRPIDYEYLYGRPDAFRFGVRVPRW
ncbi:MAG TPA: GntR family transcriptional regulator [Stellaceae bacterium]|nr:GntR family transcriptional regulator [Stellaceae bacterium]